MIVKNGDQEFEVLILHKKEEKEVLNVEASSSPAYFKVTYKDELGRVVVAFKAAKELIYKPSLP